MKKVLLEIVNLLEKQSNAISGLEAQCLAEKCGPGGHRPNCSDQRRR